MVLSILPMVALPLFISTVRNNGVISAKLGKVVLAAGIDTATVDLYGDGLVQLAMNDKTSAVLADNGGYQY